MPLLQRLISPAANEEKISVHQFMAALAEYARGAVTGMQVANSFNLTSGEVTSLQEWLDNIDTSAINRNLIHDVLMLGEDGRYSESTVKNRLQITS